MSNLLLISADCHAGAQPDVYRKYLPSRLREPYDAWWKAIDDSVRAA